MDSFTHKMFLKRRKYYGYIIIGLDFEYDCNKYDEDLMQNMTEHFYQLVEAFIENPNQQLQSVDFLGNDYFCRK